MTSLMTRVRKSLEEQVRARQMSRVISMGYFLREFLPLLGKIPDTASLPGPTYLCLEAQGYT